MTDQSWQERRSWAQLGVSSAEAFWDIQLTLEAYLSDNFKEAVLETQNAFFRIEGILFDSKQAIADSIGNLKIKVFAEGVDTPHFHVLAFDIDATFRISDGQYLSGKISERDRRLTSQFFEDHGHEVVSIWEKTRPFGFPEDFVFEDPEGPGGIHEVKAATTALQTDVADVISNEDDSPGDTDSSPSTLKLAIEPEMPRSIIAGLEKRLWRYKGDHPRVPTGKPPRWNRTPEDAKSSRPDSSSSAAGVVSWNRIQDPSPALDEANPNSHVSWADYRSDVEDSHKTAFDPVIGPAPRR